MYSVQHMYIYKNKAFAMDISDYGYYLDSTHIDYKDCHIYLLAYKLAHPEAEITVDDIKTVSKKSPV